MKKNVGEMPVKCVTPLLGGGVISLDAGLRHASEDVMKEGDKRTRFWVRKLLAHLHDPPEKAYDFSRAHIERAESYARALGLDPGLLTKKDCDWSGAAADRFIFPDPWKVQGLGDPAREGAFRHPVSGERLELPVPAQGDAERCLSDALPGQETDGLQQKFFLVWRTWMALAAQQRDGALLPYLPADTRIPDGSIWNHMSVVSALEGTRDEGGQMKSALLMFQLGPVQEFIAQARTTRDLWSGSYLLSWLTAHAIKAVTDELGPDSVIFPSLRGQPLYDWLHRDCLEKAKYKRADGESKSFWVELGLDSKAGQEAALTPGLPNRFLAVVNEGFDGSIISEAVKGEWKRIAAEVWGFLDKECPLGAETLEKAWDFQIGHFLQMSWQRWDWRSFEETTRLTEALPGNRGMLVAELCKAAQAIPEDERDARCYPSQGRDENLGQLWSAYFQLLSHRLDARRATRDFAAWESVAPSRERDALSGKEEALITREWLAKAAKHSVLRHYFRADQRLGAVNLVKRLWHLAYLKPKHGFKLQGSRFESAMDVAAGAWKKRLADRIQKRKEAWHEFMEFGEAASRASRSRDWQDVKLDVKDERQLIRDIRAELLVPEGWDLEPGDSSEARDQQLSARAALEKFYRSTGLTPPPAYYAVIALDGDGIGRFLSGEQSPRVETLLTEKAREYFLKRAPDWLKRPRPLSPSYHLGFSEALGNFGLYGARAVVESHCGQLIYSGGDDVLAMVPADEAIACVRGLKMAFQGDPDLAKVYSTCFEPAPAKGMIRLKDSKKHEPSWPLLVPGPRMTVSAGVVIAHAKTPLQDCVLAAQMAEKRAKRDPAKGGLGRNALAVTLLKRSGERIEWGASFKPGGGLELLETFQRLNRMGTGGLPGGFASRIAQLVGRFDSVPGEKLSQNLADLIKREVEWAWDQTQSARALEPEKPGFFTQLDEYLDHLILHKRPLRDLPHLFATEAFLKRQST